LAGSGIGIEILHALHPSFRPSFHHSCHLCAAVRKTGIDSFHAAHALINE
jgi:hypothetical protein